MSHLHPWTAARYPGASRDSRMDRRRKLWTWRLGAAELDVRDGAGAALTPAAIDWTGCERPPGRPAESTARDVSVLVRVTGEERTALQRAADAAGAPLSTWVREQALRAAR